MGQMMHFIKTDELTLKGNLPVHLDFSVIVNICNLLLLTDELALFICLLMAVGKVANELNALS
jgi:hypothetical protein